MTIIFILSCFFILSDSSVVGFDGVNTLKSVSVVFRHGDRTPQKYPTGFYPNDPYLHMDFEPMGYGGLTNKGKRREFEIGLKLRERYAKFLNETYKEADISFMTTDTERTKQSLLLVLAGLYPPKGQQVWNYDVDWQPIPINSIVSDLRSYLGAGSCPMFKAEYKKHKKTAEYKKGLSRFKELMTELSGFMGREVDSVGTISHLYHTLTAESGMDLTLPEWTKPYFPNGLIINATLFAYNARSSTALLRKLNGGLMLRKVLNDAVFHKKTEDVKIHLYSCHETGIAAFQHVLNIWTNEIPLYGSGVVVEMHEKDSMKYLRTLYYKGIPAEFEVRIIPGCSEYCPLEDFLRILEDQIPSDIMETCFGPPENSLLVPENVNPIVWIYKKVRKWFHL